jgi:endonuclease YncB( thermonuclease family)
MVKINTIKKGLIFTISLMTIIATCDILYGYLTNNNNAYVYFVYDGDTFFIDAEKGDDKIRLARVDAPELDGPDRMKGLKSRWALQDLIEGKEIEYLSKKRGYYGRIIAEVYVQDTINVSDWLVRNGYAVYKNYD